MSSGISLEQRQTRQQLSAEDVQKFRRDGYLIIRGVLSREEVAKLRQSAIRIAAECKARGLVFKPAADEVCAVPDLATWDDVGYLLSDARVLSIAKQLLNSTEVIYYSDSSLQVGAGGRGFHKDNTERVDPSHPDWQSDYTMLRFGVYLQDHVQHSGGLKVRTGSHRHADVTTGRSVDVATRAGDVVVWRMTTTHSGNAVKMRGFTGLSLPPRFEVRLPARLRVPESDTRVALFFTLAQDDDHLKRYLAKHNDQSLYRDNYLYIQWQHSHWTAERIRQAESEGCRFMKPSPVHGSLYRQDGIVSKEPIQQGKSKPDIYPVHGMERLSQAVGRVVRKLRKA